MDKKPILITGCSSGIGFYCAVKLSKDSSYQVFATARKEKDLQRLKSLGLNTLKLDLQDKKSIDNCVKEFLSKSDGKIYAIFNNGAYGQPGAVEDLKVEVLKEQFETNVFGTHELTRQLLPIMRRQGYGKIIQNSSVLGFISLRFRGAYNASKYALEGLSDTLRLELMGSDIYISLIEPGPIKSDFRKNALSKFIENIDMDNSYFKKDYKKKLISLKSSEDAPFTLKERSVFEILVEILNTNSPKPRYRVTKVTSIFWFLKRILSTRLLDKVLKKIE